MLQPQKVEAIYKNGVLHLLEPLEGFVEHCKVNITVDYEGVPPHPEEAQGLRRIIENIERELTTLKKFIETPEETQKIQNEKRIRELRKQLLDEGCDEELVQLVGTVPKRRENYKEEIRDVIYESAQRKLRGHESL